MAERLSYIVRGAGTPSRPGPVHKVYPYTLRDLLDAMDDARLRSFTEGPQIVIRVNGDERITFRRFEGGRETAL